MRSLRPLLLIPLAACAAPEHAEAPDFSWAWRAEVGQPITLDPAQSDDLLWSVVDAPEGSALWSTSTVEGSTFTFTPDEPGEVTLSVERCELQRCAWGMVSVQVGVGAPSSQRLGAGGLSSFGGIKLHPSGWIGRRSPRPPRPDGDTLSYSWTFVSAPSVCQRG
jgi:hypothetical protein